MHQCINASVNEVISINKRNKIRDKVVQDYQSGRFTRYELSVIYGVGKATIDRILHGLPKPFQHSAKPGREISLDRMKERGIEPKSSTNGLLTAPDEYRTIVECPVDGCGVRTTAHRLLVHLIKKHQRYDLEYLLDDAEL